MKREDVKNLDELKKKVYSEIISIQNHQDIESGFNKPVSFRKDGCGGVFFTVFFRIIRSLTKDIEEKKFRYTEFSERAEEIAERIAIKSELCVVLSEEIILPIDIAHAITPILYEHSLKYPNYLPMEPGLFAQVAIKISEKGIAAYCASGQ